MNCVACLLLLLQILPSSPAVSVPNAPGVYYRQNEKNWISLEKAAFSKTKANGLELFIETGGWSNLGMKVVCPGSKASTRISVPRPVFFVREPSGSKVVMLIRLKQEKDHRTFHKSTADITVDNTEGFPKSELRKTAVENYPGGVFSITPGVDLQPGEYLLVLGNTTLSFDFGIDK